LSFPGSISNCEPKKSISVEPWIWGIVELMKVSRRVIYSSILIILLALVCIWGFDSNAFAAGRITQEKEHPYFADPSNYSLTIDPASGFHGGTVNLQATLSLDGVPVDGATINFTLNSENVGFGNTSSSGIATIDGVSLNGINTGIYPDYLKASYIDSENIEYDAASELTVTARPVIVTADAKNKAYGDIDPALTFVSSDPNATFSGSLARDAGESVGAYAITQGSLAGIGNYTINSFVGANFIIDKATPVITWANPANITYGTALDANQLNATANIPGVFYYTPPSGTVLNSGNNQSLSVLFTPSDTTNYKSVNKSVIINVNKANQTITFNALSNKTFGDADFTVSASSSSGFPVTFTGSGVCSVSSNLVHITGAGTATVTAHQTGNSNFNSAPDVSQSFTVGKGTPVFSNLSSPTVNKGTSTINLAGNIKLGSLVPSGSVSITLNGITYLTLINSSGNFSRSFTIGSLATGTYPIIYNYPGNSNFNTISDNTKTLAVINSNATITLSNLNQTYDGQSKPVTYTTSPPGLTVAITYNGSTTAPVDAGSYAIAASITSPGYTGTANDTLTVDKVAPVFTNLISGSVVQGTASTVLGGNIKLGNLIPTGSVSIAVNGNTATASISSANGDFSAQYNTSSLVSTSSPYTITYSYSGDINFNAVSDGSAVLTVQSSNAGGENGGGGSTGGGGASSGGGGGGSGAAQIFPGGLLVRTPAEMNGDGIILAATRFTDKDGSITLDIASKTQLLNSTGSALSILTIDALETPPKPPVDSALINAYTFGPDGAKFNPSLTLNLSYNADNLPENVQANSLFIAYWDGSRWTPLKSNVDTANHCVSAPINHFSIYALLGKLTVTTPTPAISISSTPTPEKLDTPPSGTIAGLPLQTEVVTPETGDIPELSPTPEQPSTQPAAQKLPISAMIVIYMVIFFTAVSLTVLIISRKRQKA
jgi:hypothetical protein